MVVWIVLISFIIMSIRVRMYHSQKTAADREIINTVLALANQGGYDEALTYLDQLLSIDPNHLDGNQLFATLIIKKGRDAVEALPYFERALRYGGRNQLHIVANYLEALRMTGRAREACILGRETVQSQATKPTREMGMVLTALASAEVSLLEVEEAIQHLLLALQIDPVSYSAYKNLILAYQQAEQYIEAEKASLRAAALFPEDHYAVYLLATSVHYQKRLGEALSLYFRVQQLKPDFYDVLGNIGAAYQGLGKTQEALHYYQKAVPYSPSDAGLRNNLGALYGSMGKKDEEIVWLQEALKINSNLIQPLMNLASHYQQAGELDTARKYVEKTIAILSDQNAHSSSAFKRIPLLKLRLATMLSPVPSSYNQAITQRLFMHHSLLSLIQQYSDNSSTNSKAMLDDSLDQLHFYISFHGINDLPIQLTISQAYKRVISNVNQNYVSSHSYLLHTLYTTSKNNSATIDELSHGAKKTRIGFISKFFGIFEPHGLLIEGILAHLPNRQYTIVCLVIARADNKPVSPFFSILCNEIVEISLVFEYSLSIVRDLSLDVLIFADSLGEPINHFLLHNRLAPIQMVFWGNPTTTGSANVDYFISADHMEDPYVTQRQECEMMYSEQLIRLDGQGIFYYPPLAPTTILEQVNMLDRVQPVEYYSRQQFGLTDDMFIFMLAQSLFKLHPLYDYVLAQLLTSTPSNVHLVCTGGRQKTWTKVFKTRLLALFPQNERDYYISRIHIVERVSSENFYSLLSLSDVILHPFPFDGSRTSADAIIVNKPYITLPTMYLRGRMGYVFYRSMNISELVAVDIVDYLDIAITLVNDQERLHSMQERIIKGKELIWQDRQTAFEWVRLFEKLTLSMYSSFGYSNDNIYRSKKGNYEAFLKESYAQQQEYLRHGRDLNSSKLLEIYFQWNVEEEIDRKRRRDSNSFDFDLLYGERLAWRRSNAASSSLYEIDIYGIESEQNIVQEMTDFLLQHSYNDSIYRRDVQEIMKKRDIDAIIHFYNEKYFANLDTKAKASDRWDSMPWPRLFKHWLVSCQRVVEANCTVDYDKYCSTLSPYLQQNKSNSSLFSTSSIVDVEATSLPTANVEERNDLFFSFHTSIREKDFAKAIKASITLQHKNMFTKNAILYKYSMGENLVESSDNMLILETGLVYLQLGQYSEAFSYCKKHLNLSISSQENSKSHKILAYVCLGVASNYLQGLGQVTLEETIDYNLLSYKHYIHYATIAQENKIDDLRRLLPFSVFSIPYLYDLELNVLTAYKGGKLHRECLSIASIILELFNETKISSSDEEDREYVATYFILLSFFDWQANNKHYLQYVQSLMVQKNLWPYHDLNRELFSIIKYIQDRGDHLLNTLISCLISSADGKIAKRMSAISYDITTILQIINNRKDNEHFEESITETSITNEVVLLTQYYLTSHAERQRHNNMVLLKNLNNPEIKHIILLTEQELDISLFTEYSKKLKQVVIGERLTFQIAFQYANDESSLHNKTVILSNADIYFDRSLSLLTKRLYPPQTVLALLKWRQFNHTHSNDSDDADEQENIHLSLRTDSQDAWVFSPPLHPSLLTPLTAFPLGVPRCDNRIAQLFAQAGYKLYNPALFVHAVEMQPEDWYADKGGAELYSHRDSVNEEGRNVYLLDSFERIFEEE